MKAFVESQFGYCPLIWMFHSRGLNNKINRIHERALRITYKDKSSTFQELLEKDNSVSIHHRNIFNSVRHGTESVLFLGPKIWDLVPSDIKLSQSLSIFKRKIKKWVPLQCPCRLCKIYLQHVGFIQ